MEEHTPFNARIRRRSFLAGMAAASGAVLWSSAATAAPAARAGEASGSTAEASGGWSVGTGFADVTGEALGAGMNGYAVPSQSTVGIQRRQYARAFVIQADNDPQRRVAHVTVDTGLMFQSVFLEVVRRLNSQYGDLYGESNVLLQATHTHVAPGGNSGHLMVDITTFGFRPKTFEAEVSGIVDAIVRAHESLAPAELTLTRTCISDAGVNRSPLAFARNPEADQQAHPGGVDPASVTLHVSRSGEEIGFINWYSLHGTSFTPEYQHISGDNKGYAAWATEHDHGVDHRNPATAPFVAAFAQATPGDITPNMGRVPGSGPGVNDADSSRILGERQRGGVDGEAPDYPGMPTDGIDWRMKWVDMSNIDVDGQWTPDGQPGRTGPAILGAAFAASSQEDGGGEPLLGFNEGERGGTPWVAAVNNVVLPPDVDAIHRPKEMLLPVGYIPGMVQQVHNLSVHRIGGLVLVSLGFEPTITSGLRLRRTVAQAMGVSEDAVVVQGYVNGYGHYVTTPEEYTQQDYEGGATIFGRLELPALQQSFDEIARALRRGQELDAGAAAGDLTGLIPTSPFGQPLVDVAQPGRNFGDILSGEGDIAAGETAVVAFVGANPNNDLRTNSGYITVENSDGVVVADDSAQSTLVTFATQGPLTTTTVRWCTEGYPAGDYRLSLYGDFRELTGVVHPFEGHANLRVTGEGSDHIPAAGEQRAPLLPPAPAGSSS